MTVLLTQLTQLTVLLLLLLLVKAMDIIIVIDNDQTGQPSY